MKLQAKESKITICPQQLRVKKGNKCFAFIRFCEWTDVNDAEDDSIEHQCS